MTKYGKFIIAMISIILPSVAFAIDCPLYVKATIGGEYLKGTTDRYNFAPFIAIGPGLHITKDFRTDLMLEYHFNPLVKQNGVRKRGNLSSLMLNGYIDVFNFGLGRIFVGAGAGFAQIEGRGLFPIGTRLKNFDNLTYSLMAGVTSKISEKISLDLTYSWKDFGKTKAKDVTAKAIPFRGHFATFGIRFDF